MTTKTDEQITGDVIAALAASPNVRATEVVASTKDCQVRLAGIVGTLEERNEAERITSEIAGVIGVENGLTVSANREVSDLEMADDANTELSAYPDLAGVGARVSAGTAFLEGKVPSMSVEDRAIQVVSGVPGIRQVVSNLEIAAGQPIDDLKLADDVAERISDETEIEVIDLEVRAEDGRVTIAGEVETDREFDLITERASAVPGVQDLHNRVRVRSHVS